MRRRISVQVLFVIGFGLFVWSCQSEYSKTLNEELARGVRYDSLFYGISFGQPKGEFFDHCRKMNIEGLFQAANRKNYVQCEIKGPNSPLESIEMFFYPDFDEQDKIIGMDMEYRYKAWSPWNKDLHADKLIPVLKDSLLKWYGGNQFMELPDEDESQTVWVKVDGNRRIALKWKDEEVVQVKLADLTATK
ncbi:hypothetical protein [Roseivirga sp.]|uniref:hypothetical protein n=1 Tax=Roseivirga sp. TaxID=1964215 RepID=UPI003B523262